MTPSRHQRPRALRVGGVVPLLSVDGNKATPLYEQLYGALREAILLGRLRPGARLASTRTLASELGVSRFTVVSAVDRLIVEGYLTTRRGAGMFVAKALPEAMMRAAAARDESRRPPRESSVGSRPRLSSRGTALSQVVITGPRSQRNEPRPFRPRRPPLDIFPFSIWARLLRRQWSVFRHEYLDYGDPAGFRPLRQAIASHIASTRGVRCSPDQVIVTSGAQQAFDIILRLLIDPGERVWMEEPGYLDVRGALVAAGARIVPVPVDDEGIDVAAGIRIARQARLAIVSPSHQYPTGTTLSVARRMALLSWATREGAWIIEDDYDSYFRYRGRPLSALQQLDLETAPAPDEGRVVYVGTFSKTMFPSLRLGFCIVPEWLAGHAANARAIADRNSPIADQAALATFIEEGHYDRHLRRVRVVCQERHDALRHHITRLLGDTLVLNPSSAGTHVLAHLRDERVGRKRNAATTSAIAQLATAAAAHDLVVFRLSRYCLETPTRDALVLGYGGLPLRRIQWGVEQLARAAQSCGLG